MRQAEFVDTLDHAMKHFNRKWEDEVVFSVVRNIYWFCFTEYIFHQDIFLPFIKKYESEIRRNKYIRANQEGLRVIFDYFKKTLVPKRIIYSTFGKTSLSEIEKCCIESWKKYTRGYEFVELNETNCDIGKIPAMKKAYEDGRYEIVSSYYTMRELYDHGGIMFSTTMMLNGPIGELRTHKFTIGFDSVNSIGSDVISSVPKTTISRRSCEYILSLAEFGEKESTNEDDDFWNLKDNKKQHTSIISDFFESYFRDHNWPLSNQNMLLPNDVLVLSSDRLYFEINDVNLLYKVYAESFMSCKKPFLLLHENAIKSFTNYINRLELTSRVLSGELTGLKNSRSWRYTEPVRRVMRSLRSLRAKLFRK